MGRFNKYSFGVGAWRGAEKKDLNGRILTTQATTSGCRVVCHLTGGCPQSRTLPRQTRVTVGSLS